MSPSIISISAILTESSRDQDLASGHPVGQERCSDRTDSGTDAVREVERQLRRDFGVTEIVIDDRLWRKGMPLASEVQTGTATLRFTLKEPGRSAFVSRPVR